MAYTTIDDPSAHFQTALWTGNNTNNRAITNDGNSDLQPDFIWLKDRNVGFGHRLTDSTRGITKNLASETTGAEGTVTTQYASWNTDGFTLIYGGQQVPNYNGHTYVAWQWKANGGTTASNTTGDINTTTQVNSDAGFSIVTYTGNGGTNQTVGHGLGVAPQVIIVKNREVTTNWIVYHHKIGTSKYLNLDTTGAAADSSNIWGSSAPSSTTFTVQQHNEYNDSGEGIVAYCFAEKQGYSKFGKYVGNVSEDGPFVYTGFKPAFLMMKEASSAGGNWVNFDNKRDVANVLTHRLHPNTTAGDNTSRNYIDFYSNGFKMRNTDLDHNQSGETMIYMAFAEQPFVTSTGIPATAR